MVNFVLGIFYHDWKKKKREKRNRDAKQYLQDVGDDPDGPAVNSFAVRFLGEDLRSCAMTKQRHNLTI